MTSERVQRRIDQLLDEADQAIGERDWARVRVTAETVLRLDYSLPLSVTIFPTRLEEHCHVLLKQDTLVKQHRPMENLPIIVDVAKVI